MPENETTVFPPSQIALPEVAALIHSIVSALEVPGAAITWQRTRDDTPY
jgi:hypothetical protein